MHYLPLELWDMILAKLPNKILLEKATVVCSAWLELCKNICQRRCIRNGMISFTKTLSIDIIEAVVIHDDMGITWTGQGSQLMLKYDYDRIATFLYYIRSDNYLILIMQLKGYSVNIIDIYPNLYNLTLRNCPPTYDIPDIFSLKYVNVCKTSGRDIQIIVKDWYKSNTTKSDKNDKLHEEREKQKHSDNHVRNCKINMADITRAERGEHRHQHGYSSWSWSRRECGISVTILVRWYPMYSKYFLYLLQDMVSIIKGWRYKLVMLLRRYINDNYVNDFVNDNYSNIYRYKLNKNLYKWKKRIIHSYWDFVTQSHF